MMLQLDILKRNSFHPLQRRRTLRSSAVAARSWKTISSSSSMSLSSLPTGTFWSRNYLSPSTPATTSSLLVPTDAGSPLSSESWVAYGLYMAGPSKNPHSKTSFTSHNGPTCPAAH
ncbi:adrenoleukodystrophy protein [Histoplasma capsulatum]|uniref:Adrenoleukodystrophy protein n=1 Tax=Ajellomyces capsulatus TaxID=5037 RepID=A0A8A1M5L4_AJECA|nr:adrenoleukodystrophy protein [Histoplasma capsulatum]